MYTEFDGDDRLAARIRRERELNNKVATRKGEFTFLQVKIDGKTVYPPVDNEHPRY